MSEPLKIHLINSVILVPPKGQLSLYIPPLPLSEIHNVDIKFTGNHVTAWSSEKEFNQRRLEIVQAIRYGAKHNESPQEVAERIMELFIPPELR